MHGAPQPYCGNDTSMRRAAETRESESRGPWTLTITETDFSRFGIFTVSGKRKISPPESSILRSPSPVIRNAEKSAYIAFRG